MFEAMTQELETTKSELHATKVELYTTKTNLDAITANWGETGAKLASMTNCWRNESKVSYRLRGHISLLESDKAHNAARISELEQNLLQERARAEKNKDAQDKLLLLKSQWSSMSNILSADTSNLEVSSGRASTESTTAEQRAQDPDQPQHRRFTARVW